MYARGITIKSGRIKLLLSRLMRDNGFKQALGKTINF